MLRTMKLLGSIKNKVTKDENGGGNVALLEIPEVVFFFTVILSTMIMNMNQESCIQLF